MARTISASFKIEKNIPLPAKHWGSQVVPFPFLEMEVGDSFWKPFRSSGITSHNAILARDKGMKFTSRAEDHGDVKGTRVWRIA